MSAAHINRIATAVPPNDVHEAFVVFARSLLSEEPRTAALFERMADRSQIEHRYSCLAPAADPGGGSVDAAGFYTRGAFPSTGRRMAAYEAAAGDLAEAAVRNLDLSVAELAQATHLIVATCTGFSAPGIDLQLIDRLGLAPTIERTVVGFMGCYAAINVLKLARHIVRSDPAARILVVNLELCTLHLQETTALEPVLSFLLFGDGASAALVTAEANGIALDRFHAVLVPGTHDLITWRIREMGFDMILSGRVPAAIRDGLSEQRDTILGGAPIGEVDLWAVHPGGRTVLDAVEQSLDLGPRALDISRDVLRRYGNMSSATIMFVLAAMLERGHRGERGCAMAFGPGVTAETMLFHIAG